MIHSRQSCLLTNIFQYFWNDERIYIFLELSKKLHKQSSRAYKAMEPNVLPDPTADLHWSSWNTNSAIHDKFAENSSKFPDRTCVVETASRTTPQRSFTYRQIHETSNVLAHFFLQRGIERGEVIMIYAFRGVDLVVAILAVLKAGATFSVVDPA